MHLFEIGLIASPAQQQSPDLVQVSEPPSAPQPFLETEPAVMPYVPTSFDLPL
jgi:hypothetical protein